jgi:hypothetical protein
MLFPLSMKLLQYLPAMLAAVFMDMECYVSLCLWMEQNQLNIISNTINLTSIKVCIPQALFSLVKLLHDL